MNHLFAFIMAGGSGERFWPLSRNKTPKHLLRLFKGKTLLEQTVNRVEGIVRSDQIYILTNQAQREELLKALPGFNPDRVIAEPAKRDTAPAVALANAIAHKRDPDAVITLLAADHIIHDVTTFQRNLLDSVLAASRSDGLFTFAIKPSWASTGYGYLSLGKETEKGKQGTAFFAVDRFVEKPDTETAQHYVQSGNYAWNSGMFVWKVSTFLKEVETHAPELASFINDFPEGNFLDYLADRFPTLPKTSIDYAIMEKAGAVIAARADFDWDDVGSWTSLPTHLGQDDAGNTVTGPATFVDSRNNIVHSNGRMIALCGVDDLVVVDAGDAVLVCHRDKVQEIKKLMPHLPKELL
ncbi:MAG: sugar phosphate nucleotidyltransferase [Verrucomicrobiota bacterium]|nr:sugar phosphate nucleotidyltransferase [Verrucomicrobiota bacterium]